MRLGRVPVAARLVVAVCLLTAVTGLAGCGLRDRGVAAPQTPASSGQVSVDPPVSVDPSVDPSTVASVEQTVDRVEQFLDAADSQLGQD